MGKLRYEMNVDRSGRMDNEAMLQLKNMYLAPYMQLATALIGKARHAGGNMFRHQLDTMSILIDYGYIDAILLKASCIHDVLEDVLDFDKELIINADEDGLAVYNLVCEVTRKENQLKADYLRGIIQNGSPRAKVLKCADRISNMISLGFVSDPQFIERYCDETEYFVLPIAIEVDYNMYQELIGLIITRRRYLEECGYIEAKRADAQNGDA